jgi:predicted nucleotidyltransferase
MADANLVEALARDVEKTDGLVSAYLFGSVASGRAHRESDLDLGLLLDRTKYPTGTDRFELRLRLLGRLQKVSGRTIDLVILNDAAPHLARHVMTTGHRLLVIDSEQDHAHLRLMMSRAADLEPFLRRARAVKLATIGR